MGETRGSFERNLPLPIQAAADALIEHHNALAVYGEQSRQYCVAEEEKELLMSQLSEDERQEALALAQKRLEIESAHQNTEALMDKVRNIVDKQKGEE